MADSADALRDVAASWLSTFQASLSSGDVAAVLGSFHATGSYWRDLFCFSWAIRSLSGVQEIEAFLQHRKTIAILQDVELDGASLRRFKSLPGMPSSTEDGILATFQFSIVSPPAKGRGLVRLLKAEDGTWAATTLLTKLEDLRDHDENTGYRATPGVDGLEGPSADDRIQLKTRFVLNDLDVLIVGAGQSGLMLAARLWQNGLNALVIDKNPRIGDSWRLRYASLALHTPARMSSFIYHEYPSTSPTFLPAQTMADFMEYYAKSQEICVWSSTTLQRPPIFDAAEGRWIVNIDREGKIQQLRPVHLVIATGVTGRPNIPTIPGLDSFRGTWYHSSQHQNSEDVANKRVVVVGAGNTGADLCQEFVRRGAASVLMVQRSSTAVMKRDTANIFLFNQAFPPGRSVAECDFEGESMSIGYQSRMSALGFTAFLKQVDDDILSGLERAGFKTSQGEELGKGDIGVFGVLGERYRGIYLDVGCAQLIIDGSVQVKQGVTVQEATESSLVFSDGTRQDADVVVFATGYQSVNETISDIVGSELASKIGPIWGTNSEGELQGCYIPHEHPNLWMAMGAMPNSRTYSKYLALQLLAQKYQLVSE